MARRLVPDYGLDDSSTEVLNGALDGSDLASCLVDVETRTAIVTINVFSILPEDGRAEEEYPLRLVAYPIGRVAASYLEGQEVLPVKPAEIDSILSGFANKDIEDWDVIDPPEHLGFRWHDQLSLDLQLGNSQQHLMELWQDDAPYREFSIGIWFERMYVFDRQLNPVTAGMITAWRQRLKDAMAAGVLDPARGWARARPAAAPATDSGTIVELVRGSYDPAPELTVLAQLRAWWAVRWRRGAFRDGKRTGRGCRVNGRELVRGRWVPAG